MPGVFPSAPPPTQRHDTRNIDAARQWVAKMKAQLDGKPRDESEDQ